MQTVGAAIPPNSIATSTAKSSFFAKALGHYVPLPVAEAPTWHADVRLLARAIKHEKKLASKIEPKCTDPVAFKKAAFVYLSSLRCLQAAMIDANKARPVRHRQSLRQIIKASKKYNPLKGLNEEVRYSLIPKSSGIGFRPILDFGPVARGGQHMLLKLLRTWSTPAAFQFTHLGVHKAITEALRLIKEDGYEYIAEIDIKSHYPSFDGKQLVKALPLPKAAIREIGLASSATVTGIPVSPFPHNPLYDQVSSGIPQGSASSSAIAEWSVSNLEFNVAQAALINYADNFFLFAKSMADPEVALEALRAAIAALPGGSFETHTRQKRSVDEGFVMLGCFVQRLDGSIDVDPTESNMQRLEIRLQCEMQCIDALLIAAKQTGDMSCRLEGVQAYLRLRQYVEAWTAAYSICTDMPTIAGDLFFQLDGLRNFYGITLEEINFADDPSLRVSYYAPSG